MNPSPSTKPNNQYGSISISSFISKFVLFLFISDFNKLKRFKFSPHKFFWGKVASNFNISLKLKKSNCLGVLRGYFSISGINTSRASFLGAHE